MRHQGRTAIKGKLSSPCQFKKRQYSYAFKNSVLTHFRQYGSVPYTVDEFFEDKTAKGRAAAGKLISKWGKFAEFIEEKASNTRTAKHSRHRETGLATVLTPGVEIQLVQWINELRADGVPVSSKMLDLKAIELAEESGVPVGLFRASNPWKESFLQRHRLSFRARNRSGQTSPDVDNVQGLEFAALVLGWMIEYNVDTLYNADQTGVQFEMLPKRTISERGVQTVWIKCGKKEKQRATVMILADSQGNKYPLFFVFKSYRSTSKGTQAENEEKRHGFGKILWKEIRELQEAYEAQIYGNETAWWNESIMLQWLRYLFGDRNPNSPPILLLLDSFSGHWTADVKAFATSVNVILKQVPPKMTWRCQPADVAWIKPTKDGLRHRWVEHLRDQLARRRRSQALDGSGLAATRPAFEMIPPDRGDVVEWVTEEWLRLSERTIISGFVKCGFRDPLRGVQESPSTCTGTNEDVSALVEELQDIGFADRDVGEVVDDMDVLDPVMGVVV